MRILTLWQPWASLIALGLKEYETRSWGTPYRGPLLIHAARRPIDSCEFRHLSNAQALNLLDHANNSLGVVVAIADLTDCLLMQGLRDFTQGAGEICISHQDTLELSVGNWSPCRYAWKLENVRYLAAPIPWRGGQGLRVAPAELVCKVEQQLAEVA